MTKQRLPIYVPLKNNFTFDSERLITEINSLIADQAEERTLPFENGRSVYDPEGLLSIASDAELNETTKYSINELGQRVKIPGKMKTYHVFNLTYLPEEPDSLIDIYRNDDPEKKIFWHTYKKSFTWRKELEGTYIKQCVEQFPWEYVQGVRLIHMTPPSIGQIHRDSHPKENLRYFRDGFASISFNIASGNGVLKYLDSGEEKQVENNVKIFHFDDSVPHGVTPIDANRYQIRMWGKLSVPYQDLLNV
jgi:hypothetical protein